MAIVFVLVAAALLLAALAFVILPLTRARPAKPEEGGEQRLAVLGHGLRELNAELKAGTVDSREHKEARQELERQALEADAAATEAAATSPRAAWRGALAIGVAMPLAAVVLYAVLGHPAALWKAGDSAAVADLGHGSTADMAVMTSKLARQLEQNGGDLEGWLLLARSYQALGQLRKAVRAYETAVSLSPANADLLIEYANTLSVAHDRNLAGKPERLIERALEIEPDNLNALALAGAAAVQAGRREDAVRYWTQLASLIPADSPDRPRIEALLARVQGKSAPAAPQATIHGTVRLSDALANQVSPGDTLFVFARAANGPPMPLAVVRSPATGWPVSFTLDDSRAMTPELRLSQYPRVSIIARVSRSGSARAQPGDLQGRIDGVALGSERVQVIIDRVVKP